MTPDVLASLGRRPDEQLVARTGEMLGRLTVMHSHQADVIWVDEKGRERTDRIALSRTLGVTPVAGDWVVVKGGRVARVFPRRSELRRTQTHGRPAQVMAANIDLVLIVTPIEGELHHRMVKSLGALAKESGVEAVVVLSKVDESSPAALATLRAQLALDIPRARVLVTSAVSGEGVDELRAMLGPGVSAVLLGASGAGKTSLLNALEGRSEDVGALSRTGEGRHTTSTRKLYRLSSGGVLLDIPGIRFSRTVLDEERQERLFADVAELAQHCRFANCGHGTDQGCAVRAAVEEGRLDAERLLEWRTLRDELDRQAREARNST
jgi:ribosome biogenesis GTPase